jgi:hypothetical protein
VGISGYVACVVGPGNERGFCGQVEQYCAAFGGTERTFVSGGVVQQRGAGVKLKNDDGLTARLMALGK